MLQMMAAQQVDDVASYLRSHRLWITENVIETLHLVHQTHPRMVILSLLVEHPLSHERASMNEKSGIQIRSITIDAAVTTAPSKEGATETGNGNEIVIIGGEKEREMIFARGVTGEMNIVTNDGASRGNPLSTINLHLVLPLALSMMYQRPVRGLR
jgi:hypothetical protein